jgi:hypothetical protein
LKEEITKKDLDLILFLKIRTPEAKQERIKKIEQTKQEKKKKKKRKTTKKNEINLELNTRKKQIIL